MLKEAAGLQSWFRGPGSNKTAHIGCHLWQSVWPYGITQIKNLEMLWTCIILTVEETQDTVFKEYKGDISGQSSWLLYRDVM
jgi:hypothetical protein